MTVQHTLYLTCGTGVIYPKLFILKLKPTILWNKKKTG